MIGRAAIWGWILGWFIAAMAAGVLSLALGGYAILLGAIIWKFSADLINRRLATILPVYQFKCTCTQRIFVASDETHAEVSLGEQRCPTCGYGIERLPTKEDPYCEHCGRDLLIQWVGFMPTGEEKAQAIEQAQAWWQGKMDLMDPRDAPRGTAICCSCHARINDKEGTSLLGGHMRCKNCTERLFG